MADDGEEGTVVEQHHQSWWLWMLTNWQQETEGAQRNTAFFVLPVIHILSFVVVGVVVATFQSFWHPPPSWHLPCPWGNSQMHQRRDIIPISFPKQLYIVLQLCINIKALTSEVTNLLLRKYTDYCFYYLARRLANKINHLRLFKLNWKGSPTFANVMAWAITRKFAL